MAKSKRLFTVKDIFGNRTLICPTATADGRRAAFQVTKPDLEKNENLSEIRAWSGERGAWQVTFSGKAWQPQFSPDGTRLAFLSEREGGKGQVCVMERELSEGRKVTAFEQGVVKYVWSPDGRHLAVIAQPDRTPDEKKRDKEKRDWRTVDADERRRALWVVNADGRGKPRRISADGEHVSSAAWMPDGRGLVYTACPTATVNSQWFESDLKVVDAKGKGRRTVGPVRGHLMEAPMHVSADGASVLLTEAYDERDLFHDTAKVIDLDSGERRMVHPEADLRSIMPQWLPDGRVLFESGVRTGHGLYVCEVGGTPERLDTGGLAALGSAVAGDAGLVFFVGSATQAPDELCSVPFDASRASECLTDVNRDMAAVTLARSEVVTWKSDGLEIEGIFYLPTKPRARKPYPLVLMPHGGPYGASLTNYGNAVGPNVFCAAGYACLMPNFSGSTGYGRAFTRRIVRNWGDAPYKDIMAGVDSLIERGLVDGDRMAVFGGSYGGYMTTWIIGHTRRFRCAVAVAAVVDNLGMWGTTDIPDFQLYSGGGIAAGYDDAFWRDQSPLHHVGNVTTPTLVITGEVDLRVPPGQSHQYYRALKARGVETRLLLYPREPHGVHEPRHRLHFHETVLSYINEHVRGRR
ncbi:MAG: S9 family peptidase [Candidatus Brocadiaceae bacterium]|nr:S9 family peptidase [Candidatus Brocadiaceae bacterium]